MRFGRLLSAGVAIALSLPAAMSARESSGGQNVDLMARWTAATIVRYQVVAVFEGDATIMAPPNEAVRGMARVTDRFEVDLEWNQQEYGIVGKPVIRNFPSTMAALTSNNKCPAAANGRFEHATVVGVTNEDALRFGNGARLEYSRALPGGTLATGTENGPCARAIQVPPAAPAVRGALPVPHGMALAMPSGQAGFAHDGKAFIIKDTSSEMKGWTYTITPTIVR